MTNSILISLIMGSKSDWETLQYSAELLGWLSISYETKVISAHRTPDLMAQYAKSAGDRGLELIIAGAGGAAHLPGMVAAHSLLPVIGVPIQGATLNGVDSLLSIVQMPAGVPVATMAIGKPGALNAALLSARILARQYPAIGQRLREYMQKQTAEVLSQELPPQ